MNDPWTPQHSSNVTLLPAPTDPLHQIISSDKYLDSLEKKLGRLKGHNAREPTPKDIVKSLSKFRDDQMNHFLKGEKFSSNDSASSGNEVTSSYLQRRLYPEKQPVTGEELVILLHDDAVAKRAEEQEDIESSSAVSKENVEPEKKNPVQKGDSEATVAMEIDVTLSTGDNSGSSSKNETKNAEL